MSATAAQSIPAMPPRPERSADTPKVPPRPIHRAIERSLSPSKDRFAPSPLNETLSKSPGGILSLNNNGFSKLSGDHADHGNSVDLPSLGQEGLEYAVVEELSAPKPPASTIGASSPEQTRTVGDDLKLHAPKPSLPASSAKARVATVTRTDSEKAASFGIGLPSSDDVAHSQPTKKKASTTSQEFSSDDTIEEDKHGIPEIGLQVPMYPNAGDVQAPSPAPADETGEPLAKKKSQSNKRNSRNFVDLPPGSYGLHGHGVLPSDRLEKDYYSKHPELVRLEHTPHHADRAKDFSKSSDELNKSVYETASHGTGIGAHDINGTPSEQVGWQAIEESISRPASVAPKGKSSSFGSQSSVASMPKSPSFAAPEISVSQAIEEQTPSSIHVDDSSRRKSVMFTEDNISEQDFEDEAPILAPDEVAKDPSSYHQEPAVEPAYERRLSSHEESTSRSSSRPASRPASRPSSRPNSRPSSIYRSSHTVEESEAAAEEEYEPLFPQGDDQKVEKPRSLSSKSLNGDEAPGRFPSRDIWEDPPSSALYTAEVSTPDVLAETVSSSNIPARDGETPAQAFARRQEELAESELKGADTFLENRKPQQHSPWLQSHLTKGVMGVAGAGAGSSSPAGSNSGGMGRPTMGQRFPSRDVWEDAPESLQLETTVSTPQDEDVPSPVDGTSRPVPKRPTRKLTDPEKALPLVPHRPKPKIATVEEVSHTKPAVPERSKPQIPARPAKQPQRSNADKGLEVAPKPKPAVPARPGGGKIAQLQASFMSDLNKKLKIGPQAPKKEDVAAPVEEAAAEAEKAPLVDARKGRARGPQRRAPRSSASPAAVVAASVTPAAASPAPVTLSFSTTTTLFSIDPAEDVLSVHGTHDTPAIEADAKTPEPKEVPKLVKVEEKAEETAEETAETKETEDAKKPHGEEKAEEEAEEAEPAVPGIASETLAKAEAEVEAVAETDAVVSEAEKTASAEEAA